METNRDRIITNFERNSCPEPKGILVIIGGRENKGDKQTTKNLLPRDIEGAAILKEFVKLINKVNPVIEVCTTPSGEEQESFQEYEKVFKEIGAGTVNHFHHASREEALAPELVERVKKADAFFFTGGDQLKLTSRYGGTEFLRELKNRYIFEGIVIGGTSAGAMAMSTPMIYAGNEKVQQIGGRIKITTGLEFLKDVCIDTHFVERGRFVRMAQVIVTNPGSIGIGIEEDSAIIVRNGLDAEVIGSGLVILIDGLNITDSNVEEFTSDEPISIRNLRVDILKRGDKIILPLANPPHY